MTDKDRLEEIIRDYQEILNLDYKDKFNDSLFKKRLFFENHGILLVEQAERVQELEHDKEHLELIKERQEEEYRSLHEQNKRYREAMEFLKEAATQDLKTSIGTDSHFIIEVTSQELESESE